MKQAELFDEPRALQLKACAEGRHGELREGHPDDHKDCINVAYTCRTCGSVVTVKSYSKDYWFRKVGSSPAAAGEANGTTGNGL